MKHPHAELMLQYAQDAMTTDTPWELWEVKYNIEDGWEVLLSSPTWNTLFAYRRKLKKKQIKFLAYLITNVAYKRIPALDYQVEVEE